jgi:hypothetical protein
MLNKFTVLLLVAGLTAFYACKDKLVDNPLKSQPPTTKIFLDTVPLPQQSRIHLYWSGDSPNGTVLGFYFSWDGGATWAFTLKNDSLFSLQIGAADKRYDFRVAAVDNSGNGKYDSDVYQNDIHFGPEPFTDLNGNGKWDQGEPFVDVGLIDPNPAKLSLPITNTAPTVVWDILSFHPDTTFTAMTFGWDAADIDGNTTIQNIEIALNDTINTNNFVALNGTVSYVTIRTSDFTNPNPLMEIYLNGDVNSEPKDSLGNKLKLPGLKYNSNNIFYVRAVDISNAKSPWISSATQANSKPGWFVKKPHSNFAFVNDYSAFGGTGTFYPDMMDSLKLQKGYALGYDLIDLVNQKLPYKNYTFLETVKLFKGILWYTDNAPSLDLAGATVQKITAAGVKIFFSMIFPQSAIYDLNVIQQFLPILSDTSSYLAQLAPGKIVRDTTFLPGYPTLKVTSAVQRLIGFNLNPSVYPTYYFPNNELGRYVGFENKSKNIFFIALPLNKMNGIPGSVVELLYKVLFNDFNLTP